MGEVLQGIGILGTGAAAVWSALRASQAAKHTNGVEGKSVNEIAIEVRDEARLAATEARHGREVVELHINDTKRHVY